MNCRLMFVAQGAIGDTLMYGQPKTCIVFGPIQRYTFCSADPLSKMPEQYILSSCLSCTVCCFRAPFNGIRFTGRRLTAWAHLKAKINLNYIYIYTHIHTDTHFVPRIEHRTLVIKTGWLMLYREIIAVCSQIHTEHINTLSGQNVELLNVKLLVHIVTTGLWRVKSLL